MIIVHPITLLTITKIKPSKKERENMNSWPDSLGIRLTVVTSQV